VHKIVTSVNYNAKQLFLLYELYGDFGIFPKKRRDKSDPGLEVVAVCHPG
jgi:hypothetical protein